MQNVFYNTPLFIALGCDWALVFALTSKISSRDTSMRQWPAWGCCWDSSWRRILSFWTRSLLYLGTVRHSASSGSWLGDTRACWAWSFNWLWRLEGREINKRGKGWVRGEQTRAKTKRQRDKKGQDKRLWHVQDVPIQHTNTTKESQNRGVRVPSVSYADNTACGVNTDVIWEEHQVKQLPQPCTET